MGSINKLFITLQARYGNQWANQWDDERLLKFAKNEWYESLKHFTIDDIKRGLKNYQGNFPPNSIQFSKACKSLGKPAPCYELWGQPDDILKIESDKPSDYKERGNTVIGKLREIIGL